MLVLGYCTEFSDHAELGVHTQSHAVEKVQLLAGIAFQPQERSLITSL